MSGQEEVAENGEEFEEVFLVPHTHYDAVGFLTKEDLFYINIDLILKKVVDLLDKNKDYKFTLEQTFLLEEVEKRYPDLFSKVTEYIKQGRIEIAGGEYLMASTMLPQEETLVRGILNGKKYIKERFGVNVPVMWQVDRFGLNAQLPQIYKQCGYRFVAFRSGCPERNPTEFLWKGLDGTEILAHWMPLGFNAGLDLNELEKNYAELRRLAFTNQILMPSGSRITAPQPQTGEAINEWNKKYRSKMRISTPSEFFKALEKSAKNLPIRRGEMYSGRYSEVFPDSSSGRVWVKKRLRKYENWLLSLERYVSVLNIMENKPQHLEELQSLWKRILFMAFHDVLPGTSLDSVYEEVRDYSKFLDIKLSYLTKKVLGEIIDDSEHDVYGDVIVFNPLSWDVSNWVEVDLNFDEGRIFSIRGLKSGDEGIDIELIRFTMYEDESFKYARIGFVANVPAMGYKVYKLTEKKSGDGAYFRIVGNEIGTNHFRVKFDSGGLIDVIKDGNQICRANELVLEEEIGDLYNHKESLGVPLKTEIGEGVKYGSFRVKNFWIDKSPVRRVINVETDYFSLRWPYRLVDTLKPLIWRHNFLKIKKRIIIYKDLPIIDFVTTVRNRHPRLRLRVRFTTEYKVPTYYCESQFGVVARSTNQYFLNPEGWMEKPSGIFPSLRWIDYNDGRTGLTIINRGTPENEVRDNEVYVTLLRSTQMLSEGNEAPAIPVPDATENKTYVFKYSIYPHLGDWKKAKSFQQGYEFNYTLVAMQLPSAKKCCIKNSFMKIEPENVLMTAFKPSEDGEGIIVRFYEASGEETDAKITFFKEPKKAIRTNLIEEELKEIDSNSIKIKPYEIVTVKLFFS